MARQKQKTVEKTDLGRLCNANGKDWRVADLKPGMVAVWPGYDQFHRMLVWYDKGLGCFAVRLLEDGSVEDVWRQRYRLVTRREALRVIRVWGDHSQVNSQPGWQLVDQKDCKEWMVLVASGEMASIRQNRAREIQGGVAARIALYGKPRYTPSKLPRPIARPQSK